MFNNIDKNKKNRKNKNSKILGLGLGLGLSAMMVAGAFSTSNPSEVRADERVYTLVNSDEFTEGTEFYYGYDYTYDEEYLDKFSSLPYEEQKSLLMEYLNFSVNDWTEGGYTEFADEYRELLDAVSKATSVSDLNKIIEDDKGMLVFEVIDYIVYMNELKEARNEFVSKDFINQKSLVVDFLNDTIDASTAIGMTEHVEVYKQYLSAVNSLTSSQELVDFVDKNELVLDVISYEKYVAESAILRDKFVSMDFESQKSLLKNALEESVQYANDFEMTEWAEYDAKNLKKVNSAKSSEDLIEVIDEDRSLLSVIFN